MFSVSLSFLICSFCGFSKTGNERYRIIQSTYCYQRIPAIISFKYIFRLSNFRNNTFFINI